MSELVANCPRCDAQRITFHVLADFVTDKRYDWMRVYEAFSRCGHCKRGTIFIVKQRNFDDWQMLAKTPIAALSGEISDLVQVEGYINLRHMGASKPPDHVPNEIAEVFLEGATCVAVECWNAAGAMFRLCVDLATRAMLPDVVGPDPNHRTRRDLGLRLPWLFKEGKLAPDLHELASCIREDGNDGAHWATLTKEDAEDLQDFAAALLTRLYTEPRKLERANERRRERRK